MELGEILLWSAGGLAAVAMWVRPSVHFSWREMTATSTGLLNVPTLEARINIVLLCNVVLEAIRKWARTIKSDAVVIVNSGYRSPSVNGAVPGSSSTSEHMLGLAADIEIPGIAIEEIAKWLYQTRSLPIGECIVEWSDGHLHVSIDVDHLLDPENAQHEYLSTTDEQKYTRWAP